MGRFTGLLGLVVFLGLAYIFSTNRSAIRWRTVAWGLGLQVVFAFLVIKWSYGQTILHAGSVAVTSMLSHSVDGSSMVFGPLGTPGSALSIFAFAVLPTIIFVSAFFAILYHLGIMQQIIKVVAWVMQRTMGTSGAESTNVAASIFMGQTEAPLTIRPFLAGATRSELMTIMTSGMAHVSGGIMAAYISFGINAQDLLSAVIMTAPGTILVAKMLVPETGVPETAGTVHMPPSLKSTANENLVGAIARGTLDGGKLAFNVAIMLISFLALVGLLNASHARHLELRCGLTGHVPFPHSLNNVARRRSELARRLAHRHPMARKLRRIGNLLGNPRRSQRVRRLHLSSACRRSTLSPRTFSDRQLCPLRLRQRRLHRHADRRHRRAHSQPTQ